MTNELGILYLAFIIETYWKKILLVINIVNFQY
jgi:hypothetical protein